MLLKENKALINGKMSVFMVWIALLLRCQYYSKLPANSILRVFGKYCSLQLALSFLQKPAAQKIQSENVLDLILDFSTVALVALRARSLFCWWEVQGWLSWAPHMLRASLAPAHMLSCPPQSSCFQTWAKFPWWTKITSA